MTGVRSDCLPGGGIISCVDENVLNLVLVLVAQVCEYTKNHLKKKNAGTGKTTQTHTLEQGSAKHSLLYRGLCGSHPLPRISQGGREAGQLLGDQATCRGKTEGGEQVVTIAGKRRNESLELWGMKVPVVERKEHKHN